MTSVASMTAHRRDRSSTPIADSRHDFPSLVASDDVRLDGPAGSQVPRPVIDAVAGHLAGPFHANTHGHFAASRRSEEVLESARKTVAAFLGAPSAMAETVSFGANMTTLAFALARALGRSFREGDEVVVTELDHEGNRGPWMTLRERGLTVREARLRSDGTLDLDHLESLVGKRTRLVAAGWASNALGTVNDLGAVRQISRDAGALLAVDAVHYAPHFAMDVATLDPDILLCSAYKFYGPHVGCLYCRPGLLESLDTDRLRTQGQEAPERIETGTGNHASIVGTAAAVEHLASWGAGETLRERIVSAMDRIAEHEHGLARRYVDGLAELPGVTVWGPEVPVDRHAFERAPTVSITVDGHTAAEVAAFLGERGIAVWDGHFYALAAIEALDLVSRGGLLRTGFLMYNTEDDVDRLLEGLRELVG